MSESLPRVEKVAEFVSQFVDKAWPHDREALYTILDLVQERIWKAGLFHGSTKWFYVKTRTDNTIITPHGYSHLLGARIGCQKLPIRDQYFMFHENGPMNEPSPCATYSNDVTSLGTYPTLINHLQEYSERCVSKSGYKISVISPCLPAMRSPAMTIVSANDLCGRPIYTYYFSEDSLIENAEDDIKLLTPDDVNVTEGVIEGVQIPITKMAFTPNNIIVSEIYNIIKEPTHFPVEYWLVDCATQKGILAARLEPFEQQSSYNVYKVNNKCISGDCVLGLFKRSKPTKIVADSQLFITNDQQALISIAKGVYEKNFKNNFQAGEAFITDGLRELALQVREHNVGTRSPLQVDTMQTKARRNFR